MRRLVAVAWIPVRFLLAVLGELADRAVEPDPAEMTNEEIDRWNLTR